MYKYFIQQLEWVMIEILATSKNMQLMNHLPIIENKENN